MKNQKLDETDLDLRNEIYTRIYDAALSYKAALLQGKRPGRQFLFELQHQIHHHNRNYNKELLDEILDNIELIRKCFTKIKQVLL